MAQDYSALTVKQLKSEIERRGLETKGLKLKREYIEKLEVDDQATKAEEEKEGKPHPTNIDILQGADEHAKTVEDVVGPSPIAGSSSTEAAAQSPPARREATAPLSPQPQPQKDTKEKNDEDKDAPSGKSEAEEEESPPQWVRQAGDNLDSKPVLESQAGLSRAWDAFNPSISVPTAHPLPAEPMQSPASVSGGSRSRIPVLAEAGEQNLPTLSGNTDQSDSNPQSKDHEEVHFERDYVPTPSVSVHTARPLPAEPVHSPPSLPGDTGMKDNDKVHAPSRAEADWQAPDSWAMNSRNPISVETSRPFTREPMQSPSSVPGDVEMDDDFERNLRLLEQIDSRITFHSFSLPTESVRIRTSYPIAREPTHSPSSVPGGSRSRTPAQMQTEEQDLNKPHALSNDSDLPSGEGRALSIAPISTNAARPIAMEPVLSPTSNSGGSRSHTQAQTQAEEQDIDDPFENIDKLDPVSLAKFKAELEEFRPEIGMPRESISIDTARSLPREPVISPSSAPGDVEMKDDNDEESIQVNRKRPSTRPPHSSEPPAKKSRAEAPPQAQHSQEDVPMHSAEDYPHQDPPSLHPPTRALYISNLTRPLRPSDLQSYLETLISSKLLRFHIDSLRSHAFALFPSLSAASSTRYHLYGSRFPTDDPARKILGVEYLPEDKLDKFIEMEEREGRSVKRWEVRYTPSPSQSSSSNNGVVDVEVDLVDASLPLPPPSSSSQNLPPTQPRFPVKESAEGQREEHFTALDALFSFTSRKPKLYWLPVSPEIAERRKGMLKRRPSSSLRLGERGGGGDGGREGMMRYTFEKSITVSGNREGQEGEKLVCDGPEFGLRNLGIARVEGGGGGGGRRFRGAGPYGSGMRGR